MGEMMTKAVIFDVGRVLFHWDLRHLFAKLIDDPAELDHFLATVITPEWHFQHDAGRLLDDMLAERAADHPGHDHLLQAYRHRFNETIPGPVDGMHELVAELSDADVPLFIISNFGDEFWEGFAPTQPVFDHFRGFIISGKECLTKPDPAIYRLALDRFRLDPADTLLIDDSAPNIAGAETVGIAGHVFTDAPALRRWLSGFGLISAGPQ
jgi:2-haloacid dehalogenase